MKILKVLSRNIMCFGNKMVEIDFINNEPSTTELIGGNGKGKSTIMRIIKLGLYGKIEGILLGDIANFINGNGYIEIHFISRNIQYKIIRTYSPHSVKLYEGGNDVPVDKGDKTTLEKYIVNEVIDIPYYVFDNIINLKISNFKSFLNMKPEDSKKIRDRIFSFHILNMMMDILKLSISDITRQMKETAISVENLKGNITAVNIQKDEAQKQLVSDREEKLDRLGWRLKNLTQELDNLADRSKKLFAKKDDILDKNKALQWRQMMDEMMELAEKLTKASESVSITNKLKSAEEEQRTQYERDLRTIKNKNKLLELDNDKRKLNELKASLDVMNDSKIKTENELKTIKDRMDEATRNHQFNENIRYYISIFEFIVDSASRLQSYKAKSNEFTSQLDANAINITKCNETLSKLNADKMFLEQRIKVYESGECGECGANLKDDDHVAIKEENEDKLKLCLVQIDEAKESKNNAYLLHEDIRKNINEANSCITNITTEARKKGNEINQYVTVEQCVGIKVAMQGYLVDIIKMNDYVTLSPDFKKLNDKIVNVDIVEAQRINSQMESIFNDVNSQINSLLVEKNNFEIKVDAISNSIDQDLLTASEPKYKPDELIEKIDDARRKIHEMGELLVSHKSDHLNISEKIKNINANVLINGGTPKKYSQEALTWDVVAMNALLSDENNLVTEEINKCNTETITRRAEIKEINNNIDELNSMSSITVQLQAIQNLINQYEIEFQKTTTSLEKNKQALKYYDILEYTISDGGIKSYILKNIVPSINYEIADILTLLDVPLNVMFNEDFHPTITNMGREIGTSSISDGQKAMINFAILTAITKIIKMKYGDLNVIFYDEIFASIEANNRTIILDIINQIFCKQLGVHVWVVNHEHLPSLYFKQIISIDKINGFSELSFIDPNNITINQ